MIESLSSKLVGFSAAPLSQGTESLPPFIVFAVAEVAIPCLLNKGNSSVRNLSLSKASNLEGTDLGDGLGSSGTKNHSVLFTLALLDACLESPTQAGQHPVA